MQNHTYLTTREVAELLRVKERKVYELASSGELPCHRLTGKLLFSRADIEAVLAGGAARVSQKVAIPAAAPDRPNIMVGSHDPLLDWALRESGSGLAAFFDGSLDGLKRFAGGAAIACGMHIYEPNEKRWNIGHVSADQTDRPVVLIEWAKRRQGLISAAGAETPEFSSFTDLKGRRVALRQPTAGGRVLFDHLLAEAGLGIGDLEAVPVPARTETDIAATVASGAAEAALGLEAMARQFRLGFQPLILERFDLLIDRRAYFEPSLQTLLEFCRTPAFASHAHDLGGYDVSDFGTVHWNGP